MPTIVAYLDVLGFSAYTEEDLSASLRLLANAELVLREKLLIGQTHPVSMYADPSVAAVAEGHLVDSFKHFFPFSDSFFIVSETPDKFARQLSHFLIDCLLFVGGAFDHADVPARPEIVELTEFPTGTKHQEKWYPPLWRGGMAIGELVAGRVTGIEDSNPVRIPNLAGSAIIKAVRAEKTPTCRGPRLLCESGFQRNFGPDIQPFFRRVTSTVDELLWPAFIYNLNNNPEIEMYEFVKIWCPALTLWKSKHGHVAFAHYDEFLKLLVRSFLRWAEVAGCEGNARQKLSAWVGNDLPNDFLENCS